MTKSITRRVWLLSLALLIFLMLPAASWGAQQKPESIRVGALLPFSGGVELYGNQAKLGLDLAAKEINAAGGILGRPVELIYQDDGSRPETASIGVKKLVDEEKVLAVLGPITSSGFNAIRPIIEAAKTPLLYATNYEGGACSRYVFVFSTVPNQELAPLIPFMTKTFGNTYYMLGANHEWPHEMFNAAKPMITALGGKILGTEYTTGKEKDFAPLIKTIAASKPKVLLYALKGDGMQFIPQADDQGLFKNTTVAFLGLSETDLTVFGGKGQNMYVVVPFVASSKAPKVKAFVAKVKMAGGPNTTVSNLVMTHYNALMALKAALEKAGKVDKEALVNALEGLTIQTPTGPLTVEKNHHSTMNLFLAKTQGAELVTVRGIGRIKPEPGCK